MDAMREMDQAWPQWLRAAHTEGARVEITDDQHVIWRGGIWHSGDWRGGVWHDGVWRGGEWRGGEWRGGIWRGGVWLRGAWHGGAWRGGLWHGGEWRDPLVPDRVGYMAALLGLGPHEEGRYLGYRSTRADGTGRYTPGYQQPAGRVTIPDAPPAGTGVCVSGLHVGTIGTAWTYHGVDPTAQLWRVEFTREDLLDCDGAKARLRGGLCTPIPWPWRGAA